MSVSKLILASAVVGTPVRNGQSRIGHIKDIALSKRNGTVAFAILSIGGFLGIGEVYHPVPWLVLTYDTGFNGYVIGLEKEELHRAPHYRLDELADVGDNDERRVSEYYGRV